MSGLQRFIGMLDREADQAAEAAQTLARPACPVEKWQAVLVHELTRADRLESRRASRRGYGENIYLLGHLLDAAEKVKLETRIYGGDEEAFRKALIRNFTFSPDRQGELVPPSTLRRFWRMFLAGDCRIRP